MEAFPDPSSGQARDPLVDTRVPNGKNRVARISEQARGLFHDLTNWVELRLKLFQIDIQEKIEAKINEALIKIAPFAVGALGGLFALITAALFIGWALGHPAWGFLIVTFLLFIIAGVLYARSKNYARRSEQEASWSRG